MTKTIVINVIGNEETRIPNIEIITDEGDFTNNYLQSLFYSLYFTFKAVEFKIEEVKSEKIQ